MLKTFSYLTENKNWKLLIAGKGNDRYIDYLKLHYNLKNVEYLGYTNNFNFYSKIDVLIVPSLWKEPFGRVVLEGLINNKIVLGSNHGGIKELLKNNSDFLFNPFNSELFLLLKRILETPEFLNNFEFNDSFINSFLLDNTARGYMNFLDKLNLK